MDYLKTIGTQIFRIIVFIFFVLLINFPANAQEGTLKWKFVSGIPTGTDTYDGWGGPPAIGVDGTIYQAFYVAGVDAVHAYMYAVNPDGSQKWVSPQFQGSDSISMSIDKDGTTYLADMNTVYAINPDSTEKWNFWTGTPNLVPPAIGADGTIYSGPGQLYAINPDGTQKWVFPYAGGYPAIGADGTIYSTGGRLYAINPDGTPKWASFDFAYETYSGGSAIGADGTIFISAMNKLYAINPDGTQKWVFATKSWHNGYPVIGADGTIYVGDDEGNFFLSIQTEPRNG